MHICVLIDGPTIQKTYQTSNGQTDMRVHRELILPLILHAERVINAFLTFKSAFLDTLDIISCCDEDKIIITLMIF